MLAVIAAIAQAVIFQVFRQTTKKLQEKGFSSLQVLSYLRYSLIPTTLFLAYSWDTDSFVFFISHQTVLLTFFGFLVAVSLFQYVSIVSRGMLRSLTLVSVVLNAVGLPLLLLGGIFLNHDIPNLYELAAVALLVVAAFVRPTSGTCKETVPILPVILAITFGYLILQSIKDPLYRQFLTSMPNVFFAVSLYMFSMAFLINLFFLFKKPPQGPKIDGSAKRLLFLIPTLSFLGAIPEGYAFAHMAVYALVAISMINVVMNFASDIRNARIAWSWRTGTFILLTVLGVVLTIFGRIT